MDKDILDSLVRLLQYTFEDEEKDWEENEKPENHIFVDIKKLSEFVTNISEWNIESVEPASGFDK